MAKPEQEIPNHVRQIIGDETQSLMVLAIALSIGLGMIGGLLIIGLQAIGIVITFGLSLVVMYIIIFETVKSSVKVMLQVQEQDSAMRMSE